MSRFRFSIGSIMGAIAVFALGFAALRVNSPLLGGAILLATLAVLCGSILMIVARSGPSRLAWAGCAIFGWPCFILGFGPMANDRLGTPRMTEVFEEAIPYINPDLDAQIRRLALSGVKSYTESFPGNLTTYVPGLLRYRQSSQSVLTMGFAALGAMLGYAQAVRGEGSGGVD